MKINSVIFLKTFLSVLDAEKSSEKEECIAVVTGCFQCEELCSELSMLYLVNICGLDLLQKYLV